jgi:hypothetical protein
LAKNRDLLNDWFSPPPGFVTAHTSASEWRYYKALMLKLDPGRNPRQPPYGGGKSWTYQKAIEGGRQTPGGQVTDFVVDQGFRTLGLRIQTERYHVFADATKQASDFFLKTHTQAIDLVIDLFDQYSIGDPSGKATVAQVARALKGYQEPSPITFGTGQQVRPPR